MKRKKKIKRKGKIIGFFKATGFYLKLILIVAIVIFSFGVALLFMECEETREYSRRVIKKRNEKEEENE